MLDTGWLNFTSFSQVARSGSDSGDWVHCGYAVSSNNQYAYCYTYDYGYCDYLRALQIASPPSLPEGSQVTGFEIRIERNSGSQVMKDSAIYVCDGTVPVGDNKSAGAWLPESDAYATYGSSTDLWNTGYDYDDLTSTEFGVLFSFSNETGSWRTPYVDHIQIKIYYTTVQEISPTGIGSGEGLGTPTFFYNQILYPSGISSDAAFGNVIVFTPNIIAPVGLQSSAAFGSPLVGTPSPFNLLRVNSIRLQISMTEKTDSGNIACTLVSRTNKLLWSEELDNSPWATSNVSIDDQATSAPDGVSSADEIIENSSESTHYLSQDISSITSSTDVTYSVHLKSHTRSAAKLRILTKANTQIWATCDIDEQTIEPDEGYDATTEDMGYGWVRYTLTANIGSGGTTPKFSVYLLNDGGEVTYTGDGASGLYAWGFQVEEASNSIEYIKTEGTAQPSTVSTPVTFNIEFLDISSITLSVQSETAATAIYILRDVPNPWGFKIRVFDLSGTRIARTVSWVAKGV